MTDRVKLYDVEGREYVAAKEDVDRRLGEGFLLERPDLESDPDRVVSTPTVLNRPQAIQPFEPSEETVDDVLRYLNGGDGQEPVADDERERVLAAERAGRNRKGIVGGD